MRNVHKWTKEAAANVVSKYNIRKRKSLDEKGDSSRKNYHRRRRCPVSGCHSVVYRMATHLQEVHHMKKSSHVYINAISTATIVPDVKHPSILWKEERAQRISTPLVMQDKGEGGARSQNALPRLEDETIQDGKPMENNARDKSSSHPIFVSFRNWMRSPDGGKRDEKTILQHSAQLWSMLLAIDSSCDINSLLDTMLIRNIFLESYVKSKKYEAATIKSYLMSLRHFYSFLLSEKPDGVEFNVEDINAKREKIHFWSTTYKRESCTRRWQKLEEDTENLLTSESIQNFEKSEAAREAIKIIGQYSDPTETAPVVQASYILARDFLLVELFIDNANRPGVLSFMTTDEFHNMREEDGTYVIAVKKHKTAHVHGPAYIVLSKKLKAWMHVFVEVMRPAVTDSDTSTSSVFLTWNSRSMTSGQINKAVQSVFKKAGVDIKVTSTSFRKAAVTKVHESNPELSEKLAGLMSHNESTAKKYYLLWEKTKASIEASTKLGKLMRNQDASENSADESEADVSADFNESETKKRTPWKDEEIQMVKETFNEELKLKTITLGIVRDKVKNSKQLDGMSPRRVYDRLRKELNGKQKNANEEVRHELPKACESLNDRLERMAPNSHQTSYSANDEQSSPSVISPTEFASTDLFSDCSLTSMKKIFADMIVNKPISKSEIKKRCSESKEGKTLISKLSVTQIMNRIKYERRKVRSAK